MTLTALPITSAGRFSPRGPLGIGLLLLCALDAPFLAVNLPFEIGLDASTLLVGLREAPFCLGDYHVGRGGWPAVGRIRLTSWSLGQWCHLFFEVLQHNRKVEEIFLNPKHFGVAFGAVGAQ